MDAPLQSASAVNPRDLMRLLTDLQVGIRKVSMYSVAHPIIPELVASLTSQVQALLASNDALQIGVAKDEILYQGTPVAKNNPVIRELARMLNQINVASVTFRKELTANDTQRFLHLLAECRGLATSTDYERALDVFRREVSAILFQFLSFRGAVKHRDGSVDPESETTTDSEGPDVWRGLVNRLMTDELPDESRAVLQSQGDEPMDAQRLAAAINLLSVNPKSGEQSYERTIVSYLHEQANGGTVSGDQRARVNRQLGRLFANLSPEVRQRIFRVSLEPADGEAVPVEALLDGMPAPMLIEVLNQIQVSNQNVSLPMFSLLRKFVTLSESDDALKTSIESKLEGHKELFEELLVKRAERTFYPSQYRALLDEEFAERAVAPTGHRQPDLEEAEVNHHLALILIEMLDAPLGTQDQYAHAVASLKNLLAAGLGEHTRSVFTEAISVLTTRHTQAPEEQQAFFRERIQEFFQPELVTYLLESFGPADKERHREALSRLMEVVGPVLVGLLLDKLEAEDNLAARKRLLALLQECGSAAVPFVIQRLHHSQWYVVRNMVLLLRDLRAVDAVSEIVPCLQHQSSKVRLGAFQALSALAPGSDALLQAFEHALDDDDPKVLRAAVSSIVVAPDPRWHEPLSRLLAEDPRGRRRERQIAVLAAIADAGTTTVIPLLTTLRQRCLLRFWAWRKTRKLRAAVDHALMKIQSREGSSGGGLRMAG